MEASTLFSEHIEKENYRLFVVLNFISYLGFFAHLSFIPIFFWIHLDILAYFNFFSVLAWFSAYFLNRQGLHVEAIILLVIEVVAHASMATYFLGWDSGFHYYFLPMVLFLFINHKQTLVEIMLEVAVVLVVYFWLLLKTSGSGYQVQVDQLVIDWFQFMNIAINFIAIGLLGYGLRTSSMRAEADMEKLAITDSLTGLYNRRKMFEMIKLEQTRLRRSGKSFVLVITDIDLFKAINDCYGHDCGDRVLREVSELMRTRLRKQDLLARWGGEEFVLLLPETDLAGARKVIEVLKQVISDHQFSYLEKPFSLTMTFGMAQFDGTQSIEAVLKQADQLLYKGKESGRNCIMTPAEVDTSYLASSSSH